MELEEESLDSIFRININKLECKCQILVLVLMSPISININKLECKSYILIFIFA